MLTQLTPASFMILQFAAFHLGSGYPGCANTRIDIVIIISRSSNNSNDRGAIRGQIARALSLRGPPNVLKLFYNIFSLILLNIS